MMPKLSASYPRALVALALTSAFLVAAPPSRADQAAPGQSTQAQSTQAQSHRPHIGLVLAGGGAKGGAHVGVLKVLEEMHVPIDCIAGTSMGALVGGGYASGIPADELETFVTTIDWKKVVGSQGRRDLEPIEQKRAGATYSNDFELGITPEGVTLPGGLVNTSNIEDLLRTYVANARSTSQFDKLPIPYRAVATDMVTGKMVVLDKGDLATAMRASMAIPGAFAPVVMDPWILNDGGLVRNIPIDVARDLCADRVIVVNLVELPIDPKRLRTATQLLSRTMDVMIEANETLQLQTIKEGDIRIDVHMGDITTADFERVPDTIPLGEAAARQHAAELAKYAVPAEQYAAWRKGVTRSQDIETRLAEVRFEGLERVNSEFLASRSDIKAGDEVDVARLSQEAQRMSVLQDFDSVGYRLDGEPESSILTWLPKEKNWGPDYLKVDLGLYTSSDGDLEFALYGRHTRTWVNSLGAEWRNELQFGGDSYLQTSLFQPIDTAHRFFIEPRLLVSRTLENKHGNRLAHGGRGHVEDAAEAALAHAGDSGLDQRHRREHEVVVGVLPLLAREGQAVGVRRRPASVRDEHVKRPEPFLHVADQPRRAVQVARVVHERLGPDLGGGLLDALARAGGDRHVRSLGSERFGDPTADPLGRAGDERDRSLQCEVHWARPYSGPLSAASRARRPGVRSSVDRRSADAR
jgi:NTE family protein